MGQTTRYGDHTEHKGDDRKGDRKETLDETLCQAMNPGESREWVSSQREQEVNQPTELRETCSPVQ
jgi:hypothetical protein